MNESDTNRMPCDLKRFAGFFVAHCRREVPSSAGDNRMELAFRVVADRTREPMAVITRVADGLDPPTDLILEEMGWRKKKIKVVKTITVTEEVYEPMPTNGNYF
jgi:hypothetical protein